MTDIADAYLEGCLTGVSVCLLIALIVIFLTMLFGRDEE